MMKRIIAALTGLLALALPSAATAQCSGIFTAGYFCGNSAAGGGLAGAASPTAMFDRAFGGTNNSTVVRLGGVWTVLSSANSGVWITSAAGVPSISSTLPNAVQDNITRLGTIANVGAPIGATFGGTGQSSYAIGDILYANTISTLARLAGVATGNAIISGGVGVAPAWGKIGLTTHVSGQLPLANGGCNGTTAATCLNNIMPTPTRAGDIAYWNGSAWVTIAGNNSGTNVLTENSSGVPSWAAPGTGTVTSVATAGILTGGPVTTTGTLNVNAPITPQGRLTLVTGTPVMLSSQAASTTIYYTPYVGDLVPIYDGTNFVPTLFPEVSQVNSDATKSPTSVAANSCYNLLAWMDGATQRVTRGFIWTNTTTPGANSALTRVRGILLNSVAITNGPAASRGTYVGVACSNGTATFDFVYGTSASGGGAATFGLSNAYNQFPTSTTVIDTVASYTYISATIRQAGGSAGNQISFVQGTTAASVQFSYAFMFRGAAVVGSFGDVGVGFDATNAFGPIQTRMQQDTTTQVFDARVQSGVWNVGVGLHTLSANEASNGTDAWGFNTISKNALSATIWN